MNKIHTIENVNVAGNSFSLTIDGHSKVFPLDTVSTKLFGASEAEKSTFEISPSGYGIHWPLLDEDISIDGLLGIVHHPSQKRRVA